MCVAFELFTIKIYCCHATEIKRRSVSRYNVNLMLAHDTYHVIR